jgi:hypothetical protein
VDFETVRGLIDTKYTDRQICMSLMADYGMNPKQLTDKRGDIVRLASSGSAFVHRHDSFAPSSSCTRAILAMPVDLKVLAGLLRCR